MYIIYMHTYVDIHTLIYTVTEYYIKIHMHSHMHRHIVSRYYTWMHMYSHIHKPARTYRHNVPTPSESIKQTA